MNISLESIVTEISGNPSPKKRHRPRATKASIGNSKKFPQQQSKNTSKNPNSFCFQVKDAEVLSQINTLFHCCARGGELGCIASHFLAINSTKKLEIDYNAAVRKVLECREISSANRKTKDELDKFVQEAFRRCIQKEIKAKDGSVHFSMRYSLEGGIQVCKKAFAVAYGITVKHLERCSKAVKLSATRRVSAISLRSYADATIHDFTYRETEDLFYETCQIIGTTDRM